MSLGSAHRGLSAWVIQRVSSLYLAAYTLFIGINFAAFPPSGYAAWKAWASGSGIRIATALFVVALLSHVWVGLRSIWMDYLWHPRLRMFVSLLSAAAILGLAAWAVQIVLWDMRP
jgi:succinate dehydrogenase / fumarate reductase membrane anchor subunit